MRIEQTYDVVPIGELTEHPMNPRRGDEAAIAESMDASGFYGAVVAQESTGFILAGNHRYRVAVQRGAAEIPVIWKSVDDEAALRIILADNRTADAGSYDDDQLQAVLDALPDLSGTGYVRALEAALDAEPEEEPVPDDKHEPLYGILLSCVDEEDQEQLYEMLLGTFPSRKLKVVAI